MKRLLYLILPLALAGALTAASTAEHSKSASKSESKSEKTDKRELRVLSGPEGPRRMMVHRPDGADIEKETVAFLGVETAPVSAAVTTQLGLQRGTGLLINHIVPKSPAAELLQQHDILLKFDDQLLIEPRQLAVLIRLKKDGDEVNLTYLRGGKQATAKVRLAQHDVPKLALHDAPEGGFAFNHALSRIERLQPHIPGERADVDNVLSMIRPGRSGSPVRIQIDRAGGPGFRSMSINTNNSNLVFSDEEGSLELNTSDGIKTLVAKNAKGEQLHSGPVTTPEQRAALPAGVRERLEKLEAMQDVTFRTDGDFRGAPTRALRPRGVAFPLPASDVKPAPRRLPAFFE